MTSKARFELTDPATIDALRDPAIYPHQPRTVEIIQTHISVILITPPFVYKLKKPVNLGFLDYSSLARRRHFCKEEVRLNRRLSDDIYLDVVPVSVIDGKPALENEDHVVDVAVKMRQLQDGGFLHQQVREGRIRLATLQRVADRLTTFYREQRSTPHIAEGGRIETLRDAVMDNYRQIEPFTGTMIAAPSLAAIRDYSELFMRTRAPLLNRRRANGWILDGHGDLRLEHIHLSGNHLNLFDCIEFNERLRFVDPASEVAFLTMDLDAHRRPDLAAAFTAYCMHALDDPSMHLLLDFYKCYRACVRIKVEGLRSRETEVSAGEREKSRTRAIQHGQLALSYATNGSGPTVLIVMGRIGSGKSTVADRLADALGWERYASDRIRKAQAGIPVTQRSDPTERKRLYTDDMTRTTYAIMLKQALERAKRNQSTILDATFAGRSRRERLRHALRAAGIPYRFIELKAPEHLLRERLRQRDRAGNQESDARLVDFEKINAGYQAPDALEDACHHPVDATGSLDEILGAIYRHLSAYRFESRTRKELFLQCG